MHERAPFKVHGTIRKLRREMKGTPVKTESLLKRIRGQVTHIKSTGKETRIILQTEAVTKELLYEGTLSLNVGDQIRATILPADYLWPSDRNVEESKSVYEARDLERVERPCKLDLMSGGRIKEAYGSVPKGKTLIFISEAWQ